MLIKERKRKRNVSSFFSQCDSEWRKYVVVMSNTLKYYKSKYTSHLYILNTHVQGYTWSLLTFFNFILWYIYTKWWLHRCTVKCKYFSDVQMAHLSCNPVPVCVHLVCILMNKICFSSSSSILSLSSFLIRLFHFRRKKK